MTASGVAAVGSHPGGAQSISGYAGTEVRAFFSDPLASEQPRRASLSATLHPEYTRILGERLVVRGIVHARWDQSDAQRSYVDVREALFQLDQGALTARLGIDVVFWGVTESRHLVNIINQVDYLDDLDGDETFGQPMAFLTYDLGGLGVVDAFLLSWSRSQLYPSAAGRPGVPLPVRDDAPVYESTHGRWNLDLALRWSHSAGGLDGALSYFSGTSREPELIPDASSGSTALLPRYDLIRQGGLELQWTVGQWLWKAESMVRSGQGPLFAAVTAGLEHMTVGLLGSAMDLGVLVEYSYDGRDNSTFNFYDHDVFGALRLSANDVQGTEILVGALRDVESGVMLGTLEASRRLREQWRLRVTGRLFQGSDAQDPVYWFRRDDYVQVDLEYHF